MTINPVYSHVQNAQTALIYVKVFSLQGYPLVVSPKLHNAFLDWGVLHIIRQNFKSLI